MLTAQAPVGHARYPALGAGSGKSGAVTSRALYVSPDPAPSPPPQIWHASHPLSPLLNGIMKPRHAAVLALVGWYLMLPPFSAKDVLYNTPLSRWEAVENYAPSQSAKRVSRLRSGNSLRSWTRIWCPNLPR